jgi:hypothetical protein
MKYACSAKGINSLVSLMNSSSEWTVRAKWLATRCRSNPPRLTTISESANPTLEEQLVRKRLVFAAACILALPLLFSAAQSEKLTNPAPFSTVAFAGHTNMGNWCECGSLGCLCDPGEIGGSSKPAPAKGSSKGKGVNQGSAPEVDVASGLLTLALAFLFWLRMR